MMPPPFTYRHSLGPLLIAFLAIAAYWGEPAASAWFAYDRYALEGGETWRVLTANLVHTNGYHLLLNLAGLFLLWALHADYYRFGQYLRVFIWCAVGTSIGIYFYSPTLIWYAGLSGALHGIFVWGACQDVMRRMYSGYLLLVGVAIKLMYEQISGSNAELARLIDASVAVDAHLYGAISGIVLFAVILAAHRYALIRRNA